MYPQGGGEKRIEVFVENYGERFVAQPEEKTWDKHPLLQAATARMKVPQDLSLGLNIFSEAPSGASTGTSAAVTVTLVGALDRLTPGHLSTHEVALTAQAIETEMLHLQCGIQDQLCAAYGGINYIDMYQYPHATVSQIQISGGNWSGGWCWSVWANRTAPPRVIGGYAVWPEGAGFRGIARSGSRAGRKRHTTPCISARRKRPRSR